MFCTPLTDALSAAAEAAVGPPAATATIMSLRMTDNDFTFVMTSDI
jgi:hypothetical protein